MHLSALRFAIRQRCRHCHCCLGWAGEYFDSGGKQGSEEMVIRIREVDGATKIEDLQQHTQSDVRDRATKLIDTFFRTPGKKRKQSSDAERVRGQN
jgi:Atypical Arm repeat